MSHLWRQFIPNGDSLSNEALLGPVRWVRGEKSGVVTTENNGSQRNSTGLIHRRHTKRGPEKGAEKGEGYLKSYPNEAQQ